VLFPVAFELIDGAGQRHLLAARINEGSSDANTGFFGRVTSDEGLWCIFQVFRDWIPISISVICNILSGIDRDSILTVKPK